jgi:TonB family protein
MLSLASLALLLFCLALASVPLAQAQSDGHSSRRVMRNANPDYPAVLKSKGIGGTVRLNAMVLANGTVANVQILGGNPILAASAVNALMKWKYARAASASNELVTFEFNPH